MRLINADALEQIITEKFQEHYGNTVYQFIHDFFTFVIRQIRKAPTVEAEPVKHGWWVDRHGGKYVNPKYECSECRKEAPYRPKIDDLHNWYYEQDLSDYCPNCGAKMRSDDE